MSHAVQSHAEAFSLEKRARVLLGNVSQYQLSMTRASTGLWIGVYLQWIDIPVIC